MDDVKAHALYQEVDWDRLKAKLEPAPWVPDAPAPFPEPETPNVNDVYTGDQVSTARSTSHFKPMIALCAKHLRVTTFCLFDLFPGYSLIFVREGSRRLRPNYVDIFQHPQSFCAHFSRFSETPNHRPRLSQELFASF